MCKIDTIPHGALSVVGQLLNYYYVNFTRQQLQDEEGGVFVDIPDTVERALPEDYGGSWEGLLTGLAPGTEYEVQVSCINSHGNGSYSIGMRMVSAPGIPDVPGRRYPHFFSSYPLFYIDFSI